MLTEEQHPEHAEEAHPGDGVLDTQRGKGQGDEGEHATKCHDIMSAEDVENVLAPPAIGEQVARHDEGDDKHLCVPQGTERNAGHRADGVQVGGHVQTLVPLAPDAQSCADDDADDHRPASLPEEALVALEGQPHEGTAQRNGDAVVGVATEHAHQEHQQIPPMEVLLADAVVLRDEEGHDALGGKFHQSHLVAVEEDILARTEEDDEQGCGQDAGNGLVGACQTGRQEDKQGEEDGRAEVHNQPYGRGPRFPHVFPFGRNKGESGPHSEEYEAVCRCLCP